MALLFISVFQHIPYQRK